MARLPVIVCDDDENDEIPLGLLSVCLSVSVACLLALHLSADADLCADLW
jgi:hypothetical protein